MNLNTRSIIGLRSHRVSIPQHYGVTADDGTPAGHARRHESRPRINDDRQKTLPRNAGKNGHHHKNHARNIIISSKYI
jgi:hypothetical protein